MAGNRTNIRGRQVTATPTNGGTNAGDPCRVGELPGVSLNGGGAVMQAIDTLGVYALSVKGIDGSGNSAVNAGDILYYVDADTPHLSKKATGHRFGYAVPAQPPNAGATADPLVASGATTTINVRVGF